MCIEEEAKQSTEPIFISSIKNMKLVIELFNKLTKDKYLVKTLHNYQVRVQPTESSVYATIVKALLEIYNLKGGITKCSNAIKQID